MRKVIMSMNVTLDGFMSGANCELDWHFQFWNSEMSDALCEQLSKADTILLGRITFSAMAKYWQSAAKDISFPKEDLAFVHMLNQCRKIVFSNTLTSLKQAPPAQSWHNSRLAKGNISNEITKLKKQPGKDIIIYGSGKVVASLMELGLIDEYQLWVHPVLLGKGKPLFTNSNGKPGLKLFKTKTFSSGVIILYYNFNQGKTENKTPKKKFMPAAG